MPKSSMPFGRYGEFCTIVEVPTPQRSRISEGNPRESDLKRRVREVKEKEENKKIMEKMVKDEQNRLLDAERTRQKMYQREMEDFSRKRF